MSQKAARSGGEARGVCSLGAPLPQWVLAGVLSARSSEPLREQLSLPQPAEHEEREPRAGCRRLPVVVYVAWAHSISKRPQAVDMSPSRATPRSREAPREAEVFSWSFVSGGP